MQKNADIKRELNSEDHYHIFSMFAIGFCSACSYIKFVHDQFRWRFDFYTKVEIHNRIHVSVKILNFYTVVLFDVVLYGSNDNTSLQLLEKISWIEYFHFTPNCSLICIWKTQAKHSNAYSRNIAWICTAENKSSAKREQLEVKWKCSSNLWMNVLNHLIYVAVPKVKTMKMKAIPPLMEKHSSSMCRCTDILQCPNLQLNFLLYLLVMATERHVKL